MKNSFIESYQPLLQFTCLFKGHWVFKGWRFYFHQHSNVLLSPTQWCTTFTNTVMYYFHQHSDTLLSPTQWRTTFTNTVMYHFHQHSDALLSPTQWCTTFTNTVKHYFHQYSENWTAFLANGCSRTIVHNFCKNLITTVSSLVIPSPPETYYTSS